MHTHLTVILASALVIVGAAADVIRCAIADLVTHSLGKLMDRVVVHLVTLVIDSCCLLMRSNRATLMVIGLIQVLVGDRGVVVLETASKGHYALYPGLLLVQVLPSLLFSFLACCLTRCTCLQLSRHTLQVVRHLRVGLEEEQLQVSGLVLQLHLCTVLQDIRDGSIDPKK